MIASADVVERVQRSHVGPFCVHSPPCVFRASWCDGVDSPRTFSTSLGHQPPGQANRRTFFFHSTRKPRSEAAGSELPNSSVTDNCSSIRTSTKNVGLDQAQPHFLGWSLLRHLLARGRNCAWLATSHVWLPDSLSTDRQLSSIRTSTKNVGLELHGWSLLRHLLARGRNCAWLVCGCPIP